MQALLQRILTQRHLQLVLGRATPYHSCSHQDWMAGSLPNPTNQHQSKLGQSTYGACRRISSTGMQKLAPACRCSMRPSAATGEGSARERLACCTLPARETSSPDHESVQQAAMCRRRYLPLPVMLMRVPSATGGLACPEEEALVWRARAGFRAAATADASSASACSSAIWQHTRLHATAHLQTEQWGDKTVGG